MLADHRRAAEVAGGIVVAAVVLVAMVAFDVTRAAVQPIDEAWLALMDAVRVAPLEGVAHALDIIGGPWVTAPLRLGAGLWLVYRRRWAHLVALILAVAISEISIGLLKSAVARPRPPMPLVETSGFSFPSGHAIAGAVTALILVIVMLPPGPARWRWELRAGLFALVMALSRTYLQAHWLTDAVAGVLVGSASVLASVVLVVGLRNRLRPRWFPDTITASSHPPSPAATPAGATTTDRSAPRRGSGAGR